MKLKITTLLILTIFISCSKGDNETDNIEPEIQYNIQITSSEGGNVSTSGGMFTAGQQISVSVTPNNNFVFIGWSDGSTDNPRNITVSNNLSIIANFGETFTVSQEFASVFSNIDGLSVVGNNQILMSDVESVYEIDLSDPTGGSTIGYLDDLSGIEYFTNLRRLTCDRQSLRDVDLSNNTRLEYIHIWNNKLSSINLSGLENLENLQLNGNRIESIDLSDNVNLVHLRLRQNRLTEIDLTGLTGIDYLILCENPLTTISGLSSLTLIESLCLDETNISSLNVSHISNLENLYLSNMNNLNCVTVSQNQIDTHQPDWIYDQGISFSLNCP